MTSGAIRRFCLLGDYALKANRCGGSKRGRSEAWNEAHQAFVADVPEAAKAICQAINDL